MQVAEKRDEAPVGGFRHQHLRRLRLAARRFGLDACAAGVHGDEVFAVELEVLRVLAREHRVRRRSRSDENRARRQRDRIAFAPAAVVSAHLPAHLQRQSGTERIDLNRTRVQAFGEHDAFLQREFHFFVVQRVRRAVDEALAVDDRRAAPRAQQRELVGCSPFPHRGGALGAQRARVGDEFLCNAALLSRQRGEKRRRPQGFRRARGISRLAARSRRAPRSRCRSP